MFKSKNAGVEGVALGLESRSSDFVADEAAALGTRGHATFSRC